MYIDQERKVIFIHVPKTAGRSIIRAFGFYEGCERMYHFIPEQAKKAIFQTTWDLYWKFAFVRNPWERYVSLYEYHRQDKYISQFNAHSRELALNHDFKQWMFLNINKFIDSNWFGIPQHRWWEGADDVYRMEEISDAVQEIAIKLPMVKPLEQVNQTIHGSYQSYYTKELVESVREIDNVTIKKFGYKFQ